ncbi:hypothetical protein QZH41_016237, partial [Actinostola sp. cb2023]
VCTVNGPNKDTVLIGMVGGNATFLWTTTGTKILEAKWGLYDNVKGPVWPSFIIVDSSGVVFNSELDKVAPRYKNRVHFIGNISQGHAWFVITNLSLDDSNTYAAKILEDGAGANYAKFQVNLTVSGLYDVDESLPLKYAIKSSQDDRDVPRDASLAKPVRLRFSISLRLHVCFGCAVDVPIILKSSMGRINKVLCLFIFVDPPTIDHHSSINQIINETDSLSLTCTADGYPEPTITWTKSPGTITQPNIGNVYTIVSVNRSDTGTYKCTASNGILSDAMASIQVTVQYKPKIDIASSSNNIKSWNANTITLRCKWSSALPNANFTWSKPNGDRITSNVHSITSGSEVMVETGQDSGDYGLYRCIATNVVGSDQHNITVTQLLPPGPPNITVTDIEASSVIVRWTRPVYDGGSPIIDYKLLINSKTLNISAPNTNKDITGLTKNTEYEVQLYARNVAGYGNASSKVFTTKEKEPTKGKSSVDESDSNQTIIIACSVVAAMLILITVIISIVILRKKKVLGHGKACDNWVVLLALLIVKLIAAYHNDVETSDSVGRQAAVLNFGDDDQGGIPTYAAVDMTKKKKKGEQQIPEYAVVDKTKKKKRPGEIIYAELADFKTGGAGAAAAATLPVAYTETDYADISQYQNSNEPEPTYANFPGRNKEFANIHAM